jgi:hypothetical protein
MSSAPARAARTTPSECGAPQEGAPGGRRAPSGVRGPGPAPVALPGPWVAYHVAARAKRSHVDAVGLAALASVVAVWFLVAQTAIWLV